jgi:hypothetical protein
MYRWLVLLFCSGLAVGLIAFFHWGNLRRASQPMTIVPSDDDVISAGTYHTCGIKRDGMVVCWGSNSNGQLSGIPSGTFTQISAGYDRTCGVKNDSAITCWGSNLFGQLDNVVPTGTFKQVTSHCAIKADGTIACWEFKEAPIVTSAYSSNNSYVREKIQWRGAAFPRGTFKQISGLCGIKSDGSLECWRYNWLTSTIELVPNLPAGIFIQVSARMRNICGVKSDSTLVCWQYQNEFDSLGQISIIPSGTFKQVSTGNRHACGVKSDDTLACWGMNDEGQLTNVPPGTFTQVSVGDMHACGLRSDSRVLCWGNNSQGQLNNIPTDLFGRGSTDTGRTRQQAVN